MTRPRLLAFRSGLALLLLALPSAAHGYAGPGGVITGIGAFLALVLALFAALFGFVWYPLKRLARWLHGLRGRNRADADAPLTGESRG